MSRSAVPPQSPPQSPPPRGGGGRSPARGSGGLVGIDAVLGTPAPAPRAKDFSYLQRPDIYLPIPLTNVPPPFRTAEPLAADTGTPPPSAPEDLLAAGAFRAAATAAAQQLTVPGATAPTDHARIFALLYTRLACLLLLDATALAAQEAKVLEDLNSAFYLDAATGAHLVPWALRVLHVRLQAIGFGDPRRAVMSYYELAREARVRIAAAAAAHDAAARALWTERLAELGIKVAGALIEMDDLAGAAAHLASLASVDGRATTAAATRRIAAAKALLWLQLGDVDEARAAVQAGGPDDGPDGGGNDVAARVVSALCAMADGEYATAVAAWRALRADVPGDEMVGVNLAVSLLYVGRMAEGRAVLEGLVDSGYASHTLLFNLSTLYELCTDRAKAQKLALAQRVADMAPSPARGWEKTNADFKL